MATKRRIFENQVQKLALRQVRGCLQPFQRSNPVRFFTQYSRSRCFKLSDLLDSKREIQNGHVILGFTKDGSHLISYSLVIDTRLELPQPLYSYILHWWRFSYNKPLIKVHSVPLFSNHAITDALHLIISQSLDEKQVIVWGRSSTCPEEQSCRCYVTISATISSKPCAACQQIPDKKCVEHSFAAHFTYDTLPPYPVFLPSISLQIPSVILFNCGDSLVAMKCAPCSHCSQLEQVMQDYRQPKKCHSHKKATVDNSDCKNEESDEEFHEKFEEGEVECLKLNERNTDNGISNPTLSASPLNQHKEDTSTSVPMFPSQFSATPLSTSQDINCNYGSSQTKFSFRLYYSSNNTNLTTTFDECDVINREIPVTMMYNDHLELQNTLSMASYNTVYGMATPSVLVCQAFLDMEECINELIESHEDLRDRYKSLRDYDCQFLNVCPASGDVIVMVKVLIYAKRTKSCLSEGLQVSPSAQLHQTGFVFSWNIWNGVYQTLHYMDVEDHPQGKGFSRLESSIESSRGLRQHTTIPVGFASQVRVFSNHTVFSEKSLKYLLHPFLPIVMIL